MCTDLRRQIEDCGRAIVSTITDDRMNIFSYTVGNSLRGVPELIIFGFLPGDAKAILDAVSLSLLGLGRSPLNGENVRLGDFAEMRLVACRESVKESFHLISEALVGPDYALWQIVVPDQSGRYPGDRGCEAPYSDQPSLGLN